MNYTHDKNQIVFLKDADIISAFNEKNALDEVVLSNGIPSYELFKKTYDELSTYDNNLSNYVKDHINVSVDNISALLSNTILSVNGISVRVNELCSELSNAHNALSTALSNEIEKLSTSLSNTVKLSVEQLCSEIMSNDVDIAKISAYLSNDVVHYKGDVALANQYKDPEGQAIVEKEKELFGLLLTNASVNKNRNYKILKGFVFKATTTETTKYFDVNAEDGKLTLTNNAYIIAVNDIVRVEVAKAADFTVINDNYASEYFLSSEIKRISSEISTELSACELSVNGLSVEVNRISSELSTELSVCELSVNGLSVEVNRISSELSTELSACELSVNSLSNHVDNLELSVNSLSTIVKSYKDGLSGSIVGLSSELNQTSSYLNNQVVEIWKDIKGAVNYKGHIKTIVNDKTTKELPLSILVANFYNTHGSTTGKILTHDTTTGEYTLLSSIPLNNGWMYCINIDDDVHKLIGKYVTDDVPPVELSEKDYLIIHSHDDALSCVELSNIGRNTIDIIETQDDDYVRIAQLQEVSSWLSNDYTIKIQKLSADLSGEIDDLALSVTGLSDYIDSLTLSVNGLSVKTATICSELSIAHNALSTALSNEIEKLSTALSTNIIAISSDLSNEIEKLSAALSNEISNDCMHYKGNLIFDPNDASLTATFIKTFGTNPTAIIKLGDFFRFNDDHTLIEGTTWKYEFEENDFIIFKNATIAKSVTSEDFVIIKDYDKEILRQYSKLTAEVKVISDDICLSTYGISTYVDSLTLSVNGISVEVDRLSTELSTAINSLSTELSTELCCCELSVNGISARVNVLCSEISTELSACELSVNGLSNYINTLELSVNGISARVNTLCTEISNYVILSVEELQKQIISNDTDISAISSDLSVLDYHYNRTFTEEFYQKKSVGTDLSVDVLNIVDGENTNNQYTLQFLSGTLVLVKNA